MNPLHTTLIALTLLAVALPRHGHAVSNATDQATDQENQTPATTGNTATIFDQATILTPANPTRPDPIATKKLDLTPILRSQFIGGKKKDRRFVAATDRYVFSLNITPSNRKEPTIPDTITVGDGFGNLYSEDFTLPQLTTFTMFPQPIDLRSLTPKQDTSPGRQTAVDAAALLRGMQMIQVSDTPDASPHNR